MIQTPRRRGPLTPPAPLSRRTPNPRERGEWKKHKLISSSVVSLLAREGGREAGEEGRGGEGPEAAETPRSSTTFSVKKAKEVPA